MAEHPPPAARDPAVARLWALTASRLLGVLLVLLGLWQAAAGRVPAGLVLALAGLGLVALLPRLLLRRWLGPRP
ncbi:hypothetical protein [Thermaurantiacus sp.]